MLASFPASMLNQNRPDLGIPNRFKLDPSRSSGPKWGSAEKLHAIAAARSLDCTTSINRGPRARELPRELPRALPFQGVQEVRLVKVAVGIGQRFGRGT